MKRERATHQWNDEETERMRALIAEHNGNFAKVASIMGFTPASVRHRWRLINITERERLLRNEREYRRKARKRLETIGTKQRGDAVRPVSAPQSVFVERDARQSAPLTISAFVLGDPPVGYSALDRKRQGIAEPVYIDNRQAQLQRRPSLAGTGA